jgi:hypothetical protein
MGAACSIDVEHAGSAGDKKNAFSSHSAPSATRRVARSDSDPSKPQPKAAGHARTGSGSLFVVGEKKREGAPLNVKKGAHLLAFLRSQDAVTAYSSAQVSQVSLLFAPSFRIFEISP